MHSIKHIAWVSNKYGDNLTKSSFFSFAKMNVIFKSIISVQIWLFDKLCRKDSKGLVTLKRVAPSDVIWNKFDASNWLTEKRKERVPMGGMKLVSNDIWLVKQWVRKFPDSHSRALFAPRPRTRTRFRRVRGCDNFLFCKRRFFRENFLPVVSLCIFCDNFYSILLQYWIIWYFFIIILLNFRKKISHNKY